MPVPFNCTPTLPGQGALVLPQATIDSENFPLGTLLISSDTNGVFIGGGAGQPAVEAGNAGDWRDSVRVATTGNIVLSGLPIIDTVQVAADDRVMAKDQTLGSERGVYIASAGPWVRAADYTSPLLTACATTIVEEGAVNKNRAFMVTNVNPIVVGTDTLVFTQFGGSSGTEVIIAGQGLTRTLDTLDVGAGAGITVAADSVAVNFGTVGDVAPVSAAAAVAGVMDAAARIDHTHLVTTGVPSNIGFANATGAGPALAASNHVHALPFSVLNTVLTGATASINVGGQEVINAATPTTANSLVTKAYADGMSSSVIAGGGLTKTGSTLDVGAGAGITVAADTVAVTFGAAVSMVASSAAASDAGSTTQSARIDHRHQVSVAAPVSVGSASNVLGSATTLALSDHIHALPFSSVQASLATADAFIGLNAQEVRNAGAPTTSTSLATKAYVDSVAGGGGGGSGDVVGPASATDESIARYDGTTGKLLQNSSATLNDAGLLTTPSLTVTTTLTVPNDSLALGKLVNATGANKLVGSVGAGADYQEVDIGAGLLLAAGTLSATGGGGSGYATVQEEGTGVTTRTVLNFVGNSVTAVDNAGQTRTDVTLAPPGADTQVLFKDGTDYGADAGLTYNKTTDTLTAVGAFSSNTISERTAASGVAVDGLTIKDAGFALGSDANEDVYVRRGGALTRIAAPASDYFNLGVSSGQVAWVSEPRRTVAATNPAVSDDNTTGYVIGSRWVNTATDKEYVATDVSTGAALWVETTSSGGGSGDVVGPASSTDEALARFDSTTGKLLQNSTATLTDAGVLTSPTIVASSTLTMPDNTVTTAKIADANVTDVKIAAMAASKLTGQVSVASGGTGLASGTSGGVPYYSGASTIASSGALTANRIVLGGGAGAAPTTSLALGSANQVLGVNTGGTAHEYKTITAGSGISVTPSANALTIAATSTNAWGTTGNSGTSSGTNFIGTTDSQDLVLRANNSERFKVKAASNAIEVSVDQIHKHANNTSLKINSGLSGVTNASIELFGQTSASPNVIKYNANSHKFYNEDGSTQVLDAQVGGVTLLSGVMVRGVNNSGMTLAGGTTATDGANIELYGPTSGLPNHIYIDADLHTFRAASGVDQILEIAPSSRVVNIRPVQGQTGQLRFKALDNINSVAFKAFDTIPADVVFQLPTQDRPPNSVLRTDGNGRLAFYYMIKRVVTTSQTIASGSFLDDEVIICNAGSPIVITLPSMTSAHDGRKFTIKRVSGSASVQIDAAGGNFLDDGATTNITLASNQAITYVGDGVNLWISLYFR